MHRLDLARASPQSPIVPASSSPAIEKPAAARSDGWRETLRFLLTFFLLALLLRTCIVMPRSIPSESMMPRLLVGDYLLVAKWPYGWSRFSLPWAPAGPRGRIFAMAPARGDVVVFRAPPDDRTDYIKRLIGLPGDRVQMRGGQLFLNGLAVPKVRLADFTTPMAANTECSRIADVQSPYGAVSDAEGQPVCHFPRYRETLPGGTSYDVIDQGDTPQDDTPVVTVPAGHYFLMGDNRDMSEDSRFPAEPGAGIGLVPAENLEGRALVSFFSTDGSAHLLDPLSWVRSIRWERIGRNFR
ncbi:MAG: signal peptidase [Sphingomonas bacterium]|nr:signal peptidase [Sphingomonas bacterium]